MTRSCGVSPLKVATKGLRAEAKYRMVPFWSLMQARAIAEPKEKRPSVGITRRNPGRMDGATWNGGTFICAQNVDGLHQDSFDDEDEDDHADEPTESHGRQPITVSLLDIARLAKRKGVAREFEIVDRVQQIIALDGEDYSEDMFERWEDDDEWEIYDKKQFEECRSYSDVLKGNDNR